MNKRINIRLKIFQNKGHFRILCQRRILFGLLLIFPGLFNPAVSGLRANVYPENLISKIYPVDIFNVNFSNFRTFGVKPDVPVSPFTKKHSTTNTRSQQPSDQCYFKEGYRSIADKGPEPAILDFSGIYSGYPFKSISFITHLPYFLYPSWTGNCIKIRPPPML
jgi:hypothetical protein